MRYRIVREVTFTKYPTATSYYFPPKKSWIHPNNRDNESLYYATYAQAVVVLMGFHGDASTEFYVEESEIYQELREVFKLLQNL